MFSNNVQNFNPAASKFAAGYNRKNPQLNYTVDSFNAAKAANPGLALLMATQGGQGFRNAIMQQDGMSQNDMNQFINNTSYSNPGTAYRGLNPANVAALKSFGATVAPQTFGAPTPSTYGASQGLGNGGGFGPFMGNLTNNLNNQKMAIAGGGLGQSLYGQGYTGFGNSSISNQQNNQAQQQAGIQNNQASSSGNPIYMPNLLGPPLPSSFQGTGGSFTPFSLSNMRTSPGGSLAPNLVTSPTQMPGYRAPGSPTVNIPTQPTAPTTQPTSGSGFTLMNKTGYGYK